MDMADIQIDWDDRWLLGDQQVDEQHQYLIQLVIHLMNTQDVSDVLKYAMELYSYARVHFQSEEALMQQRGYADLPRHRQLHDQLISQLNAWMEVVKRDPREGVKQIHAFMMDWLIDHVICEDMKIPRQ